MFRAPCFRRETVPSPCVVPATGALPAMRTPRRITTAFGRETKHGARSGSRGRLAGSASRFSPMGVFVVVSPPQGGRRGTGSITIVEGSRAQSIRSRVPHLGRGRFARAPPVGGLARRDRGSGGPASLGGWIEAAGTMLGFELTLDGKVQLGELVQRGRRPPHWFRVATAWRGRSRTVAEATSGGMKWEPVAVPEADPAAPRSDSRACGPVGCSAAGWLQNQFGANPRSVGARARSTASIRDSERARASRSCRASARRSP